MKIEEQVLSIEQMKHLRELGVDTSDASMCWVRAKRIIGKQRSNVLDNEMGKWRLSLYKSIVHSVDWAVESVPTYTIGDLIEKLMKIIGDYLLLIDWDSKIVYYQDLPGEEVLDHICEYSFTDRPIIDTLYDCLCWVARNNKESESLFEEILENAPKINGIRIGDYLLENGDYTRPQKGLPEDKVVGIVAGFHEGNPLIAALTFFVGACNNLYNSKFREYYNSNRDAIKAFNGRSITKKYKEGSRDDRFEAFEACINYRKDKDEEWYFGAAGEVITMIDNCIYLNAAHQITGLGFVIGDEWYHSCSEDSSYGSWGCYLDD